MKKRVKKGFTLVELVVVIAIIAILSSVSVAGYFGFTARARKEAVKSEASEIANLVLIAAADDSTNVTMDTDAKVVRIERGEGVTGVDAALLMTTLNDMGWTLPTGATLAEPKDATLDDDAIASLVYTRDGVSYTITVYNGTIAE